MCQIIGLIIQQRKAGEGREYGKTFGKYTWEEKNTLLKNMVPVKLSKFHAEEEKWTLLYFSDFAKPNSNWSRTQQKIWSLSLTENAVGNSARLLSTGITFLNRTLTVQASTPKIRKWDLVKLKRVCTAKDTVTQANQLPIEWRLKKYPLCIPERVSIYIT